MASNTAKNRDWEKSFSFWAQPPSDTEQQKCSNAENVIRKVLSTSKKLNKLKLKVFAQGSYRNRTNVRSESDVDICVLCTDYCFTDLSNLTDLTNDDLGHPEVTYTFPEFKEDVGIALQSLGKGAVTRGNKAFDVHANSYRVDADVVPCFQHIRYTRDNLNKLISTEGTEFFSDAGERIINWPDQHYRNGVSKNKDSGMKFKSITRILKNIKHEIEFAQINSLQKIPSFLIECLVWNTPNSLMSGASWGEPVRSTMLFIYDQIKKGHYSDWGEVNDMKYLFHTSQPWTPKTATDFIESAWEYVGFK